MLGENLSAYLSMLGEPATWSGSPTPVQVLFQRPSESLFSDQVVLDQPSVVVTASDAAAFARGQTLQVAAGTFAIQLPAQALDDGAFVLVKLTPAP